MTHKKRPTVYITRKLPDVVETRMRELFDAELNIDDTQRREEELVAAMQRVDVLVPTVTDRITAAMIEKAGPQLKLIASFSNGIDHVDVDAAARKGITVTNTPNVLTEDSADITMALVLAVPRRLIEGTRVLANGADEWLAGRRPDAGTAHFRQTHRHCRHGPHRYGSCAARQGFRPPYTITTANASTRRRKRSLRQPIGTASTRCWRGWILFPSIAPPHLRPIT